MGYHQQHDDMMGVFFCLKMGYPKIWHFDKGNDSPMDVGNLCFAGSTGGGSSEIFVVCCSRPLQVGGNYCHHQRPQRRKCF